MKIIDLSHTLEEGMPVFPGMSKPSFKEAFTVKDNGFKETNLNMLTHTGTHIDCPAHMLESDITTDNVKLNLFYGNAFVADFSNKKSGDTITKEDLKKYADEIDKYSVILIHTNWDKFWGTDKYFDNFPYLTIEATRYLVDNGIKTIGLDVISIDAIDAKIYSNHFIALQCSVVIVENLRNLDLLVQKEFIFSAFPLKIKSGDGSPVRAVAII